MFSWMLLTGLTEQALRSSEWICFNPCSHGCCSPARTRIQGEARIYRVSILVLMDVAHRPMISDDVVGLLLCFNPCSHGCCSPATRAWLLQYRRYKVSILVLMDVAHRQKFNEFNNHNELEFQSLFSWMLLTGPECGECLEKTTEVSILVLMDVAHRPLFRLFM